jgi:hypothetical protein
MQFPGISSAARIAKNYYLVRYALKREEFEDLLEVLELAKEKDLLQAKRADQLRDKLVRCYKLLHK